MAKKNITYTFDDAPSEATYAFTDDPVAGRDWNALDLVKEPLKIAGEAVAGLANIPVKATKGLYGLGTLLATGDLDKATAAIGDRNAITSPWASKTMAAAGENVIMPALQKTSDVTGVPMEALTGVLEAGGDIASLVGFGGGIPKTGLNAATSPLASAVQAAKNVTGKAADVTASGLTHLALKQPSGLSRKVRNQNIRTMLEGGYRPTPKGVAKLDTDIGILEDFLQSELAKGNEAGLTGTLDRAAANIEALRQQAIASGSPVDNVARIDKALADLQTHPLAQNGAVALDDLQRMKVTQGRELQKTYGEQQNGFQNIIDKARVRGLKEEIEAAMKADFPGLASKNAELSRLYQLKKVLDPAANRIENSSTLGGMGYKAGVGGMIGNALPGVGTGMGAAAGTAIGLAQNPFVGPHIANLLNKVNHGRPFTNIMPEGMPMRSGLMGGGLLGTTQFRGDEN